MDRDTIIRLARQAAFHTPVMEAELIRFVALVAAHEREECAKVALTGTGEAVQTKTLEIIKAERERIANAIRGE